MITNEPVNLNQEAGKETELVSLIERMASGVRELETLVERVAVLENHSPETNQQPKSSESIFKIPHEGMNLELVEKDFLVQALEKCHWNQTRAARLLGLTRHTLRYRMEKYGLLHSNRHSPHMRSL